MSKKELKSEKYKYLLPSIKEWMTILGYADGTIYGVPKAIERFLLYLEEEKERDEKLSEVNEIEEITKEEVTNYFEYLKTRKNLRKEGGGLSSNALKKERQALNILLDYLRKVGKLIIEKPKLIIDNDYDDELEILSEEEIERLFLEAETYREPPIPDVLNARDRAILTIFYSAGLRRNEGEKLNVDDIRFEHKYVVVNYGKNYTNRKVPLSKRSLKYLEDYIYNYRPKLLKEDVEEALFVNMRGARLSSQSMYKRLKILLKRANINTENIGLHILRHSIATHLLIRGMSLERISAFLGHKSLESTQIYTHLIEENRPKLKEPTYSNIPRRKIEKLFEDEL